MESWNVSMYCGISLFKNSGYYKKGHLKILQQALWVSNLRNHDCEDAVYM